MNAIATAILFAGVSYVMVSASRTDGKNADSDGAKVLVFLWIVSWIATLIMAVF
jgi:hypothetical protein